MKGEEVIPRDILEKLNMQRSFIRDIIMVMRMRVGMIIG